MGSQRVRQNWPTRTKSEIFTSCHVFAFSVFWWEHLKSTLLVSFMIRYSAFNYGSRYPLDPQTSVIWNLFVLFDQLLPKHPTPQCLPITVLLSVFMSLFLFFKIFIYLAAPDLSCGLWDLVPWPGIELRPPASGVYVHIYHIFFICSSTNGHWGCFLTLRKWFLDFDPSFAGLDFISVASQLVWVNTFLTRSWLTWKRFRMSLLLNVHTQGSAQSYPKLGADWPERSDTAASKAHPGHVSLGNSV